MIIYLYCRLPDSSHAAAWRDVPGDTTGRRIVSCFVLLRMGFTQPPHVTVGAVVSYTAIPPLPVKPAVSFLLHWPSGHPDRTLSGTLPCGARTFLTPEGAIICATLLYPSIIFEICKGRILPFFDSGTGRYR